MSHRSTAYILISQCNVSHMERNECTVRRQFQTEILITIHQLYNLNHFNTDSFKWAFPDLHLYISTANAMTIQALYVRHRLITIGSYCQGFKQILHCTNLHVLVSTYSSMLQLSIKVWVIFKGKHTSGKKTLSNTYSVQ